MSTKNKLFLRGFSAYYFLKVHLQYIIFKDKKSKNRHKALGIKVLFTILAWQ